MAHRGIALRNNAWHNMPHAMGWQTGKQALHQVDGRRAFFLRLHTIGAAAALLQAREKAWFPFSTVR